MKSLTAAVQKNDTKNLLSWNKWLAWVFAVQGVAILVLSAVRTVPLSLGYLGVDPLQTQGAGHTVLAAGSQHLFDINLAWLVAAMFFAAAIAYGLAATKLQLLYERDLKKGLNRIRWIGYAVSGTAMALTVGLLLGVQDIAALLMLIGLTVVASLMGCMMEMNNQGTPRQPNWLSFIVGAAAGGVAWLVFALYLVGDIVYGAAAGAFVYWVFGGMLLLSVAAGANMYMHYRKLGKWTNYLYTERIFMALSLIAKTVLAWLVFAGILHP